MAGGRLWLTNSLGELAAFAPETGAELFKKDVADSFFLPPVIANNTLYLLSDDGSLIAMR
jgi:outer membrane protein assembly factor BamB